MIKIIVYYIGIIYIVIYLYIGFYAYITRLIMTIRLSDISNNNIIKSDKLNNIEHLPKYCKKSIKNNEDLKPISYEDYMKGDICFYDYSLLQLKASAKTYSLRISGRKHDIIHRITEFFNHSKNAIIIQKIFRSWICRYIVKLRGPGLTNRDLCVNDTDFCTMEPLNEIDSNYFYSFTDENKFTYGFNICSLIELLKRNNKANPYNRDPLSSMTVKNIVSLYSLSFILCDNFASKNLPYTLPTSPINNINRQRRSRIVNDYSPVTRTITNMEDLTRYNSIRAIRSHSIDNRISELFIEIDALGNYTNREWFDNLDLRDYIRLYRKLYEIWYYRGELSREVQNNICPFYGPFDGIFSRPLLHSEITIEQIKTACLIVMENMVYSGINIEFRKIGTLHALSALTVVSASARNTMYWLYESVSN